MHIGNNCVFSAKGDSRAFPILLVKLAIAVGLGSAKKYTINNLEWMKQSPRTQSIAEKSTAFPYGVIVWPSHAIT